MMTPEEAIRILQKEVDLDWFPNEKTEALKLAISALRPVSREKVEKAWKGDWCRFPAPPDRRPPEGEDA